MGGCSSDMHQDTVCIDSTVGAEHRFYLVRAVLTEIDGYGIVAIYCNGGSAGAIRDRPAQRHGTSRIRGSGKGPVIAANGGIAQDLGAISGKGTRTGWADPRWAGRLLGRNGRKGECQCI